MYLTKIDSIFIEACVIHVKLQTPTNSDSGRENTMSRHDDKQIPSKSGIFRSTERLGETVE